MKWWFFHLRTNKQQLWIDEADLPSDAPRQMTAAASEHTALKWWTHLSAVMTGLTKWRLPQLLLSNLYSGEGFLTLQNNKSNRWSHQHRLLLQILIKAASLFKCWISQRVKGVVLNVSVAVCSCIVCVLNILSLKHCPPPLLRPCRQAPADRSVLLCFCFSLPSTLNCVMVSESGWADLAEPFKLDHIR